MVVTENTKISEIIKANEKAIEVIASINAHFNKLRNPILRKLLASRVTVKQAAGIGNTTVEKFLEKLKEINFQVEFPKKGKVTEEENEIEVEVEIEFEALKEKKGDIVEMDVRPILDSGKDPLNLILKELKALNEHQTLLVINSFKPTPLIFLLQNKGYEATIETKGENLFYTYLKKGKANESFYFGHNEPHIDSNFEAIMAEYKSKLVKLDVRPYDMPTPMLLILKHLEVLEDGQALYVHHKKTPHLLFPELVAKGFRCVLNVIDENNVKLIIYRS